MPPCRWWQVRSAGGASVQTQYAATARSSDTSRPWPTRQAAFCGGEVEGARGDVDVRDLHGDGLELRQAAAELGAALDVVGGEVAGADDDARRGQAEAQRRTARPACCTRSRRRSSSAEAPSRTTVWVVRPDDEPDSSRVTPGVAGSTSATTGWSPCVAVTSSRVACVGVGDADLAAGDRAVGVRRLRARRSSGGRPRGRPGSGRRHPWRHRAAVPPAAPRSRVRRGSRTPQHSVSEHRELDGAGSRSRGAGPRRRPGRGPRRRAPRARPGRAGRRRRGPTTGPAPPRPGSWRPARGSRRGPTGRRRPPP